MNRNTKRWVIGGSASALALLVGYGIVRRVQDHDRGHGRRELPGGHREHEHHEKRKRHHDNERGEYGKKHKHKKHGHHKHKDKDDD